jgi:hypothetical protein
MCKREKGLALPLVVAFALILAIVGFALLRLAEQEIIQTRIETDKTRAFYYAEAGLAKLQEMLQKPVSLDSLPAEITGSIEGGSYRVIFDFDQLPCYAVSIGTSGSVQKRIRVQPIFLAPLFENAVYSMNLSGSAYAFQLRGTGDPVPFAAPAKGEQGGRDIINGNVFVNGDAYFYEQSSVNPAPTPNLWGLNGDVGATGNIYVLGSASISGEQNSHAPAPTPVDLLSMDYANNNTYNVSQIMAGVSSGRMPAGNPLRDVFIKNPGDRTTECGTTSVNDYFFEPSTGMIGTPDWRDAPSPINAGENVVYYIDGDLWVHSKNDTYGFKMTGKATIVVTGNIHICDNLKYADENSVLGLIALGKYDSFGNLISGGNIYFGDPTFGTMYTFASLMFAANNFLYNINSVSGALGEPKSGFVFNGSFAASNQISINRDWYTKTSEARPAVYKPATSQWVDAVTGTVLTSTQTGTLRHYQMVVNYDDRVRSQQTQPPGLPGGGLVIFAGFSHWEEL